MILGVLAGLSAAVLCGLAGFGLPAAFVAYVAVGATVTFAAPMLPLALRALRDPAGPTPPSDCRNGGRQAASGTPEGLLIPGLFSRAMRHGGAAANPRPLKPKMLIVGHDRFGGSRSVDDIFVDMVFVDTGFDVDTCSSLNAAVCAVIDHPARWQMLCVNLDIVDREIGLVAAVERLRFLRRAVPVMPVMLLSSDFARHDDDPHRAAIADVSLRLPVSEKDLLAGIETALANNLAWQHRATSPNP